jgi:hypothetical protein
LYGFDFAVPTYVAPQDTLLPNCFAVDNIPTHDPFFGFHLDSISQLRPEEPTSLSTDTSRLSEVWHDFDLESQPKLAQSNLEFLEGDSVADHGAVDELQAFTSDDTRLPLTSYPSYGTDHSSKEVGVSFGSPATSMLLSSPAISSPGRSAEDAKDLASAIPSSKSEIRALKRKRDQELRPNLEIKHERSITPGQSQVCEWEKCGTLCRNMAELR